MRTLIFCPAVLVFLTLLLFAPPAAAQDTTADAPWQAVISHQIQAFRDRDAPEAFFDAGLAFHAMFPNPYAFFEAIVTSGYAPIMDSVSHSFGEFRMMDEEGVMQMVTLTGKSQELYQAVYQLREEEGAWRVQGVMLQKSGGIGV